MLTFRDYCGILHVIQYFINILHNNDIEDFDLFDIIRSISIDNIDDYGCCWKKVIDTEEMIKYKLETRLDLKFVILEFSIVSISDENVHFIIHDRYCDVTNLGNSVSELMKAVKGTIHSYLTNVDVCIDYLDNFCANDILEKLSSLIMAVKLIKSKKVR